ncbi:MAG TPA: proline dehydrogenase, partial [Polyangiaceae bacterium]
MRTAAERVADVRRLLLAARAVHAGRERLAPAVAASTGLSPQGVELGFDSLEQDATDAQLGSLVAGAGDAPHVHVVLSANVFVAPLRALVLARAASSSVSVRPSPRDPVLTRALVAAAGDPAIVVTGERDVSRTPRGEVHVYGRDATIAAVRAEVPPGVTVRGHGAGMGVAVVSAACDAEVAARALAVD